MLIQVNTDKHIDSGAAAIAHFSEVIKEELSRYDEHITRVEAHLSDENGSKNAGDDKKCVLEAKVKGSNPIVVTVVDATVHQSVKSAAEKVATLLEKTLEKRRVQS